jgi:hypothetical protein
LLRFTVLGGLTPGLEDGLDPLLQALLRELEIES